MEREKEREGREMKRKREREGEREGERKLELSNRQKLVPLHKYGLEQVTPGLRSINSQDQDCPVLTQPSTGLHRHAEPGKAYRELAFLLVCLFVCFFPCPSLSLHLFTTHNQPFFVFPLFSISSSVCLSVSLSIPLSPSVLPFLSGQHALADR